MASDKLQRFIFDASDVRGEIITLADSFSQIRANGNYPDNVSCLIGQLTAAAGLLSATMKFDGILTLQARGNGAVSLLMADCTQQRTLRAIASLESSSPEGDTLEQLLGEGHLAITIDPARGERYQGIVPLHFSRINQCIEEYFARSEQLPTRLWLFCDSQRAGGLLLQALPLQEQSQEDRDQYWDHLCVLADTLTEEEFLATSPEEMLLRLFHQEQVKVFPPQEMQFGCNCSEERTIDTLRMLGEEEVRSIIAEQGQVDVQCQFCHQEYRFDIAGVDAIFSDENRTLH